MIYLVSALIALTAYLIGSISGAILISKSSGIGDIREQGSKNPGTTNMLRVHGKKYAILTLLVDVLKGVAAVFIGIAADKLLDNTAVQMSGFEQSYLIGNMKYIAAVFAILGHDFPIYFGFRGGKGVATSIGCALVIDWRIGLIVMSAALIIMITTRYVSLGSVAGAVIYPCIVAAFMVGNGEFIPAYMICAIIIGLLIVIKHHKNIVRLKNGTENKLFSKKSEQDSANVVSNTAENEDDSQEDNK